ncbi:Protein of unknown function (DUF179) [Abeliophyllum distichum]|uniref:Uncharacterized protein n=1 Tax=Abeliophyllum distichum TaxID=126358 RepID=A0ABD1NY85_9LAMI
MDLWCVHVKTNNILLRNSIPEKPVCWNLRNTSMAFEIRVSRRESFSNYSKYRSVLVRAMGKKNPSNSNSDSNSSSFSSGNNDQSEDGIDGLKGNSYPSGSSKSSDSGSQKSPPKYLDWREFRALLYIQEQAEIEDSVYKQGRTDPGPKSLPLKWAHPISAPENGCLLVATEKLDGVRTFERTVVLLLRSGTGNPQEGPFGVVINRPLHKKMKHMNPTNVELATTFADSSLHFGGPLEATSGLVKKGALGPRDFRFFIGYAGWQLDQLREEIESDYWYVAACSANLIFGGSQNSDGLWEEILQLMGGHYSELSRKPKQDL